MSNLTTEIEKRKKEIENLEQQIRNCSHEEYNEAIYDSEEKIVMDDRAGYEVHGSDRWPKFSSHKETVPRWSRQCKKCGYKEYTYKQEAVIKEYKPKFN